MKNRQNRGIREVAIMGGSKSMIDTFQVGLRRSNVDTVVFRFLSHHGRSL